MRVLPRFEVVARRRPVRLLVPGTPLAGAVAPYVAVEGVPSAELTLASGEVVLTATYDDTVALTLTGPQVTAFTREAGQWVARSRFDLTDRHDVHDEAWLGGLAGSGAGGRFGQLGLRDLRLVSHADGSPFLDGDRLLLTATSAGPGAFPTGHASVWALDPETYELEHRADLFLRRDGRVFGDHAVHLVRDDDRWLLAASTWGDFERKVRPVGVTLSVSTADLTRGVHVLDSRPLALPTTGLRSVGVWDPHLVRTSEGWLVGYVSATRYFRFHPVLAAGADLDALELAAVASGHRETEGTTLVRLDEGWRVLASDRHRKAFPVLDLDLREVGTIDAAYPTNIPWPTLATSEEHSLLIGFDGTRYGGRLVGYGSHGDVVIQRAVRLSQ